MSAQFYLKNALLITVALVFTGCASGPPEVVDLTKQFKGVSELNRLRFFKETNAVAPRKELGLTGKGVRITVMGEQVDATHPDLIVNIKNQYNAFVRKGAVLHGRGNMPYGEEHLKPGYGHGTHIAGTIGAACDDTGIQGIACNAEIDVYDLGSYDNIEDFPSEGWGDTLEESRFLQSFTTAVHDVTRRGVSKIVTGSFNLEAPAIATKDGGPLQGLSIAEILNEVDKSGIDSFRELADRGYVSFDNSIDLTYLERMEKKVNDSEALIMSPLLPRSKEWADLINALSGYQKSGGVYIVTESNEVFDNHTSIFNALPTLSNSIDEDLWINVVMVDREGIGKGKYSTPINTCGEMSRNYCLITPSYFVLSTMTERVAEWGDSPLFVVDGRYHQVFAGHSMGAPMIAAGLALMQEYNQQQGSHYSMKDLVRFLKQSANKNFPGYDPVRHGVGMLDIGAALKLMGAPIANTSQFQSWSCETESGGAQIIQVEYVDVLDEKSINLNWNGAISNLNWQYQDKNSTSYSGDVFGFVRNGAKGEIIVESHRQLECELMK